VGTQESSEEGRELVPVFAVSRVTAGGGYLGIKNQAGLLLQVNVGVPNAADVGELDIVRGIDNGTCLRKPGLEVALSVARKLLDFRQA
jgi:hypothetical protein